MVAERDGVVLTFSFEEYLAPQIASGALVRGAAVRGLM